MKLSRFWIVATSIFVNCVFKSLCDDVDEGGSLAVPTRKTFFILIFQLKFYHFSTAHYFIGALRVFCEYSNEAKL